MGRLVGFIWRSESSIFPQPNGLALSLVAVNSRHDNNNETNHGHDDAPASPPAITPTITTIHVHQRLATQENPSSAREIHVRLDVLFPTWNVHVHST
jgi:hypothetical protein